MLLQSSNQAANALAEHVAGSREAFAGMMNETAASLGCRESHFVNPSGLNDPEQLTSAYDMAQIGSAVFNNPALLEICSSTSATLPPTINNPNGRTYYMEHKLVVTDNSEDENYYPSAVAGKTGYTSLAGQTLVTYAKQDDRRQVAVTLKSTQRTHYSDTKTILDFGFARFKNVSVAENETAYVTGDDPVTIGDTAYKPSDLYLDEKAVITLPKDAQFSDADQYLQTEIPASHPEGAVGRLIYTYNDRQIGVAWLYSINAVSAAASDESSESTENTDPAETNTTDDNKNGTPSDVKDAKKNKKPLKLTKGAWITVGIVAAVLLVVLLISWIMIQRKKEEERMRILREKRRKRLADMGCSEKEFERLVNERKNVLRERPLPEPDEEEIEEAEDDAIESYLDEDDVQEMPEDEADDTVSEESQEEENEPLEDK